MGISSFIIAAGKIIRSKQGIAFAQKLIGAGVGAIEAKGAGKAIEANKGATKALQREIADGKDDLQREIAAGKSDLKLLKFGYGPIVLALLIKIAFFS